MKDFRVIARIYNNRMREHRELTGLAACPYARSIGVDVGVYTRLEALRESPLHKKYKAKMWRPLALKIAAAMGVEPAELWPQAILEIKQSLAERRLNAEEVATCMLEPSDPSPFGLLAAAEESQAIADALRTLSEREREIIIARFVDGDTLEEIGKRQGVGEERIRQLEERALRKMRHPSRSGPIAEAAIDV